MFYKLKLVQCCWQHNIQFTKYYQAMQKKSSNKQLGTIKDKMHKNASYQDRYMQAGINTYNMKKSCSYCTDKTPPDLIYCISAPPRVSKKDVCVEDG